MQPQQQEAHRATLRLLGLDYLDREKAKRQAVEQAHHLANERYGHGSNGVDYLRQNGGYGADYNPGYGGGYNRPPGYGPPQGEYGGGYGGPPSGGYGGPPGGGYGGPPGGGYGGGYGGPPPPQGGYGGKLRTVSHNHVGVLNIEYQQVMRAVTPRKVDMVVSKATGADTVAKEAATGAIPTITIDPHQSGTVFNGYYEITSVRSWDVIHEYTVRCS